MPPLGTHVCTDGQVENIMPSVDYRMDSRGIKTEGKTRYRGTG